MKLISLLVITLTVCTCLELAGRETGRDYVRPTLAIKYAGETMASVTSQFGTYLVWLSDVVGLMKNLWYKILNFFGPFLHKLVSAVYDILSDTVTYLVINPISAFMSAYKEQLKFASGKLSTVFVSIFWTLGGSTLLALILEIIGITKNKRFLRPSVHILALAQYIYNEFFFIGWLYLKFFDVIGFLERIVSYLNFNLRPYIEKINEGMVHIARAYRKLIQSPLRGFFDGFISAFESIAGYLQNITLLFSFSIIVLTVSAFYHYFYVIHKVTYGHTGDAGTVV